MKNLFTNLAIFLLLTLVLSAFIACENPKTTADSADPETTSTSNETWTESEKSKEDNKTDDKKYPPAPKAIATAEFEFLDGTTFKLEENKGKVVLFNLWAIWCGPCIQEMPHLNELHEKFKDDGLIIVGVNTGNDYGEKETKANIEEFMQNRVELKYPVAFTERTTINEFFLLGQKGGVIPQSFLFDREGQWRGVFQGGSSNVIESMKENVEKIVKEK